jgi:hypothetical protein
VVRRRFGDDDRAVRVGGRAVDDRWVGAGEVHEDPASGVVVEVRLPEVERGVRQMTVHGLKCSGDIGLQVDKERRRFGVGPRGRRRCRLAQRRTTGADDDQHRKSGDDPWV